MREDEAEKERTRLGKLRQVASLPAIKLGQKYPKQARKAEREGIMNERTRGKISGEEPKHWINGKVAKRRVLGPSPRGLAFSVAVQTPSKVLLNREGLAAWSSVLMGEYFCDKSQAFRSRRRKKQRILRGSLAGIYALSKGEGTGREDTKGWE